MTALVLPPKWRRKSNAEELRQTFCENGKPFVQCSDEEMENNEELADNEGSAQMDLSEVNVSNGAYVNVDDMWMSEGMRDDYDEEDESDEDEGRRTDPDYVEEGAEGDESDNYDEELLLNKKSTKTTNLQQRGCHPTSAEEQSQANDDTTQEQGGLRSLGNTSSGRVRLVHGAVRSSSDETCSDADSDSTLSSLSDSEWNMVVYD